MKQSMRKKRRHLAGMLKAFFAKVKTTVGGWTFQQKMIAVVSCAAVVIVGTTVGILLHNAKPQPENQVVEAEVVEEVKVTGNKVEVPTFNKYNVSTESMVQDLKIYFTDDEENRVSGVPFSVILTTQKKLDAVEGLSDAAKVVDADDQIITVLESSGLGNIEYSKDLLDKANEIIRMHAGDIASAQEELKALAVANGYVAQDVNMSASSKGQTTEEEEEEKKTDVSDVVDTAVADAADESNMSELEKLVATGEPLLNAENEQAITLREYYLIQKQNDVAAYGEFLSKVEGKTYNDDDCDGFIKIDKIDGGDYMLLCTPQAGFDTAKYETKATVKAELEYKKVQNIKKEVVKDAGDTQPAEAAPVEAKLQDTVKYAKSSSKKVYTYTAGTAKALTPGGNKTPASVQAKDGATFSVDNSGATLYGVGSSNYNSVTVKVTKPAGAGEITYTASDGITVTKISEDTYQISVPDGAASANGTVKFTTAYTYQTTTTKVKVNNSRIGTRTANDNQVTVTFELNGGTGEAPVQTIEKNGKATKPADPTKEGYTFAGWYLDGAEYNFDKEVTQNITLTAQWAEVQKTDVTENLEVTVNVNVVASNTAVTDASGATLYKAQDIKQVATVADVIAGTTLYTAKEDIIYTGWQSIDNKSYYFNPDNNQKVTGEQVINGVKYTFNDVGILVPSGTGIDVSKWQGTIDWNAVAPNVSFAIIRCGYRGSSGGLSVDPQYARNMQQAKAHGVRVGIYIYSKATNEAMAVEEASLAIQLAQEQGGVSLPIYIDIEDGSQKGLSKDQLTSIANAFCQTVANSGYRPGVYASYNWWNQRLDAGSINASKWVARYNTICGMPCDIWQYSSKGTMPGISGNVDVNQGYF